VDCLGTDATALSAGNNLGSLASNAVAHAFTSARWTSWLGREKATDLGNLKEGISTIPDPLDQWKDQYNNEVRRRISEYVEDNNLPKDAIDDLVIDALNNGDLIVDQNSDPRALNQVPASWSGPSANWQGSSLGRDYGARGTPSWCEPGGVFHFPPISPLVLDLDGDGVEITSISTSTAYFDLNQNGFAERTAWISPDDAFLALDRNGNGAIDDLSELFGGAEVDGFTTLSAHDSNHDGFIDAGDAVFGNLLVWRDLDGDGLTDAGELNGLSQTGVSRIALGAEFVDRWYEGNWISHQGQFTWSDGRQGTVEDVWFENDQVQTIYRYGQSVAIAPEAELLPDLAGYGTVKDLSAP
jgi:hypothetical protein